MVTPILDILGYLQPDSMAGSTVKTVPAAAQGCWVAAQAANTCPEKNNDNDAVW